MKHGLDDSYVVFVVVARGEKKSVILSTAKDLRHCKDTILHISRQDGVSRNLNFRWEVGYVF